MFTDTDSLLYEIKTEDVYKDLYEKDQKYFDTSDYPSNSEYYSEENKKVIGQMKDAKEKIIMLIRIEDAIHIQKSVCSPPHRRHLRLATSPKKT